jgi:mannosyl-3-phosphoglycerate phosphatase family protein
VTKTIIFTDLDGTLLHPKSYSFADALPALALIKERGIPLVLCSSKTRAELEVYRRRLGNADPFVSENGGGVFIPRGYFSFLTPPAGEEYLVKAFGKSYEEIRKEFILLRNEYKVRVRGFGDMSADAVATLTGLSFEESALARKRDFGEPFVFKDAVDEAFLKAVERRGLHWTRGRLFFLMGNHDKGRAVALLKQWYEREHGMITTIGLGDALNDLPLLREVDHPVIVQKEDGSYDPAVELPGLIKARGVGPEGWNRVLLEMLP